MSACFLKRPLLSGPFPFCQRQFFFLDPRVGPGYFKAFPAQEFIFGLQKKEREIGTGSRMKRWWHQVKRSEHGGEGSRR